MTDDGRVPSLVHVGDQLLFAAVVVYALALLCFAGEQAARRGRAATAVPVGAGAPLRREPGASARRGGVGRLAVSLTAGGAVVHLTALVLRAVAVGRPPWGDTHASSTSVAFLAVAALLWLLAEGRVERTAGPFVLVPVLVVLGVAATVLPAPLAEPGRAPDGAWQALRAAAGVLGAAAVLLAGAAALLHLLRARAADAPAGWGRLPGVPWLDRAAWALLAFAFPLWTFALLAGAVWPRPAWGRHLGQAGALVPWLLCAGYLHARARSAGRWDGRRAAWVAVAAALALVVDLVAGLPG